jgi:broad specificity phosphatase PhoE
MTNTTTIYIVRHGQTEWNVEHRLQGHQDSPLTELGVQQAEWLGESIQNERIDVIYTSSSPRASRTAEIIRGARQIEIIENDRLKELNLGIWEGKRQEEVKQLYPEQFQYFWEDPEKFAVEGSETFQEVAKRAVEQLLELIRLYRNKSMLIVTHTVVVKLLMAYFEERAMEKLWDLPYIHPTCLCKIEMEEDEVKIVLHGDISHMKELPNGG